MKIQWIVLMILLFGGIGFAADKEALHQLNREITLLNLINGLYLTPDQTTMILEKCHEAEAVRQMFWKNLEAESKFEETLESLHAVLMAGEEIPESMKQRVHRMKTEQHRLEDERGERLIQLEAEIESLLTPNQRLVIADYKPCTIPPAQGKIGQSMDAAIEGLVRQLDRIRHMPYLRYNTMKEMLVDMHIDRINRHLGFQDTNEENQFRTRMLDAFQQARILSDKDYLIEKNKIAQELMPEALQKHKRRKNELTKTGRFLLDPALITILEQRRS